MRRLLIRPGAIGDCILSFPALEHLKAEYTEVWCPAAVVPLIQFADCVRPISSTGIELFAVGDLEPSSELVARLKTFDSIVSWYGSNRLEFREAMTRLGVPCEFHRALPPGDYEGAASDFYCEQTGADIGLLPRIHVGGCSPRDTLVIHPLSGSSRKNWPLDKYRELASMLTCRVQWTAGPEEHLEEAIRFANLRELGEWIRGARLYIGNDSGITHLAAAVGIPVIAIFGPASTRTWMPRGPNVRVLETESLDRLEAKKVCEVANRLLR